LPELHFTPCPDPIALREADDAGMDLYDFSQDYLVNGIKLTFFCPDPPERQILSQTPSPALRVATMAEIFALKALVTAKRSKKRDWFDLYVLMRDHGYTWKDFRQVFDDTKVGTQYEHAARRLCSVQPAKSDEGFDQLLPGPTITVEEMHDFFSKARQAYETIPDENPPSR
jgi:hypothetical protein